MAQVAGAIVAACVLYSLPAASPVSIVAGGLASNGYGEHSPGGYRCRPAFVTEVVMTLMFL